MSRIVARASTAAAWVMPLAETEFDSATNRRHRKDMSRVLRVRMEVSGGVSGTAASELRWQYSHDQVSWFPLGNYPVDGLPGPSVPTCKMSGSTVTTFGAWIYIVEDAQTDVYMRVVGSDGNGAASPTFAMVAMETSVTDPEWPANSLANVTPGKTIVAFGGSQISGAQHGSFGPVDPAVAAILEPLFVLGAAGGGITYIRNGVTLTTIPNEHGPEIGMFHALYLAGKHAGITFLGQYSSATSTPTWVASEFANVISAIATAGITPNIFMYIVPGQDSVSLAARADMIESLPRLDEEIRERWPEAGVICMGCVAEDSDFPARVESRTTGRRFYSDHLDGRRCFVEHDIVPIELQVEDNTHPTAAGTYDMGFYGYAPPILASGILE